MSDIAKKSLEIQLDNLKRQLNMTKDNLTKADILSRIEKVRMSIAALDSKPTPRKNNPTKIETSRSAITDKDPKPEEIKSTPVTTIPTPDSGEPVVIASSDTDPIIDLSDSNPEEDHNRGIVYSNATSSDNNEDRRDNKKKKH